MDNKSLDIIAMELLKCKTLAEKQNYLLAVGRIPHIIPQSKVSRALSCVEPDRFMNVGSNFYFRKDNDSDRKFKNICIRNGEYLYEYYPIIFEFYDEYLNGIDYEAGPNFTKGK